MGVNGPSEIKNHPWLRGYQWDDLLAGRLIAPFIPAVIKNFIIIFFRIKTISMLLIQIQSGKIKKMKPCRKV